MVPLNRDNGYCNVKFFKECAPSRHVALPFSGESLALGCDGIGQSVDDGRTVLFTTLSCHSGQNLINMN